MGSMFGEIGLAELAKIEGYCLRTVYDETPRTSDFLQDEQAPEDPIIVAGYIDLHDQSERRSACRVKFVTTCDEE